MSECKFQFSEEEMKALAAEGTIMQKGLVMDEMEGIWLAWETYPEAVQALLPPVLGFAAPVIMTYIVKANTEFGGAYNEAALMVLCHHEGKPGAYLQSILLEGPAAPQAAFLGREMAGMPKKICDSISLSEEDGRAHARIVKSGSLVLECDVELGEYNTPAGNEVFAGNVVGEKVHGGFTYLIKGNLEQAEDGHMFFENGRLLSTESDSLYERWTPGTASVTLHECEDAPWASLPVRQVLAAGWGKYSMFNFTTSKVCDIDIEENLPYLLRARYDKELFA